MDILAGQIMFYIFAPLGLWLTVFFHSESQAWYIHIEKKCFSFSHGCYTVSH